MDRPDTAQMATEQARIRSRERDAALPWRRWYKTARWQRLRWFVLVRDLFTCQMPGCGRVEPDTAQLVADHIRPHRGDEALFWAETNIQCVCKSCHDGLKQRLEQESVQRRGVWD